MEPVGVGLLGVGTVGSGVARLLREHGDRIARRAGRPVQLRWAVVRDPSKPRDVPLGETRVVTDPDKVIADPEVAVVIETMGGTDLAFTLILKALAAGKHVVTANKALLAERGPEIFAQA
ncbi:MAG: homoserine dehydrogenase, partial [Isosphaeraceae bacterium]